MYEKLRSIKGDVRANGNPKTMYTAVALLGFLLLFAIIFFGVNAVISAIESGQSPMLQPANELENVTYLNNSIV